MTRRRGNRYGGGKPRRDWSKILFYVFSVVIVLSMVLAAVVQLFTL